MASIEVCLNEFVDMETGKRTKRYRCCLVSILADGRASILYTRGEHKGGMRITSPVAKIYRRPVRDLAHNHLWDEVVIRTANSEYVFSQAACECDRDYEDWDLYDKILMSEALR